MVPNILITFGEIETGFLVQVTKAGVVDNYAFETLNAALDKVKALVEERQKEKEEFLKKQDEAIEKGKILNMSDKSWK